MVAEISATAETFNVFWLTTNLKNTQVSAWYCFLLKFSFIPTCSSAEKSFGKEHEGGKEEGCQYE